MEYLFYQDANGIQHESYEDACRYYGVDTPAQCEAEDAYWAEVEADQDMALRQTDATLPYMLLSGDKLDSCPF